MNEYMDGRTDGQTDKLSSVDPWFDGTYVYIFPVYFLPVLANKQLLQWSNHSYYGQTAALEWRLHQLRAADKAPALSARFAYTE